MREEGREGEWEGLGLMLMTVASATFLAGRTGRANRARLRAQVY